MNRKNERPLSVRFSDEIIVIPPREHDKKAELRTTITELGTHDEEQAFQLRRPGRQQQIKVSDEIAILLALLCTTIICFILGVVGWAFDNPRDLCDKATQLAVFYNRLPAAVLAVLPGVAIGFLLARNTKRGRTAERDFERGWTTLRLVLTMLLVALVTAIIMPWTRSVENSSQQIDCSGL